MNQNTLNPPKKAYRKPALTRYGPISLFTTGGSGTMQEVAMGPMGGTQQMSRFP